MPSVLSRRAGVADDSGRRADTRSDVTERQVFVPQGVARRYLRVEITVVGWWSLWTLAVAERQNGARCAKTGNADLDEGRHDGSNTPHTSARSHTSGRMNGLEVQ